jgi:hypothetical protein
MRLTGLAESRHRTLAKQITNPFPSRKQKNAARAQYGSAMTIAIVAKSVKNRCFISITDRMMSFDGEAPAIDNAVFKDIPIRFNNWNAVFSAHNNDLVTPIWQGAVAHLASTTYQPTLEEVQDAFCRSYTSVLHQYVTREYLSKFGIKNVDDFRQAGASQLGSKLFWSLPRKVDTFNAGVDFLVYGFDHTSNKSPHMFIVKSPGNVINLDHLGYYAIGSGARMAMASLNLRPVQHLSAGGLVYGLCEAKFSAETADGVGTSTTGFIMNMNGHSSPITSATINKFRCYWDKWRLEPPPEEICAQIKEIPDLP